MINPRDVADWIEARQRYHLSHATVLMARELGMNPRRLGSKANHDQEPWKAPLAEWIASLYQKRFGRPAPDLVLPIEDLAARAQARKAEKNMAKKARRAAADASLAGFTYEVRPARPDDLDALADLRAELWPDGTRASHADEARAILSGRPPGTLPVAIFVAMSNRGEVAGFAEVGLRSHAEGCDPQRPVAFLEGWFVKGLLRRRGIGRALVAATEAWGRAQGCLEMASDTGLQNVKGQRAHVALGFAVVERLVAFRKAIAPATGAAPTPLS